MKKISYLRAALFLPVMVGVLALLLSSAGYKHDLVTFTAMATLVGGAPLLLTLSILLVLSYRAPSRVFEKWWWLSPFIMTLSCGLASLAVVVYGGMVDRWGMWMVESFLGMWLITGFYSLALGYAYVLLAAMLHGLLRTTGLVQREAVASLSPRTTASSTLPHGAPR